jgi:hypothetical protein
VLGGRGFRFKSTIVLKKRHEIGRISMIILFYFGEGDALFYFARPKTFATTFTLELLHEDSEVGM